MRGLEDILILEHLSKAHYVERRSSDQGLRPEAAAIFFRRAFAVAPNTLLSLAAIHLPSGPRTFTVIGFFFGISHYRKISSSGVTHLKWICTPHHFIRGSL
jgi:hypothetical protein